MFKKWLYASLLLLTLQACTPTANVVGQEGMAWDPRPAEVIVEDSEILKASEQLMKLHPIFSENTSLEVAVYNQTLLIVGRIATPDQKTELSRLLKNIPGIRRFYNQVTLGKALSYKQKVKDSWITTKVISTLLTQPQFRYNHIKVICSNQNVYLMGLLSEKEVTLALDAVQGVSGVKKIIRLFEIT